MSRALNNSEFSPQSPPVAPSPIPTIRRCFHVSDDKLDDAYIDFVCLVVAELSMTRHFSPSPGTQTISRCSILDASKRSRALYVVSH